MEVTHMLAGTMIKLGGEAETVEEGIEKSKEAIANRQAFEKWLELTEEQGGDTGVLKDLSMYKKARYDFSVKAPESGYLTEMDAYNIGIASLELGAGRKTKEDAIDPTAGIELKRKTGDQVKKGETLAVGFTNNKKAIETARDILDDAFSIAPDALEPSPMITHRVDRKGIHKI
jgi:pyrimidine-nucleoside phosphorylase